MSKYKENVCVCERESERKKDYRKFLSLVFYEKEMRVGRRNVTYIDKQAVFHKSYREVRGRIYCGRNLQT